MSRHIDRILNFLIARPNAWFDDGEIRKELGIANRATVNQRCRRLAEEGKIARHKIDGKLKNSYQVGKPDYPDRIGIRGVSRTSNWDNVYGSIIERLEKLPRFTVDIVTENDFTDFIKKFNSHLRSYDYIWMSGFFDNSYARIVEKHYYNGHKCDVKVVSLGFRKDGRGQQNAKALEKMENKGVEVMVNENLHARMYIAYNEQTDMMTIFLGSFDYTKECMAGTRRDIGIRTSNPDLILRARMFFIDVFASTDSKTLVEYKKGINMV